MDGTMSSVVRKLQDIMSNSEGGRGRLKKGFLKKVWFEPSLRESRLESLRVPLYLCRENSTNKGEKAGKLESGCEGKVAEVKAEHIDWD